MAIERQIATPAKGAKVAAPPAPRKPAEPPKAPAASGTVAQIRGELAAARRDLALQKLDSPAMIRQLRKKLARALTVERAKRAPTPTTEVV